jgi:hypothetical protein
MAKLKAAARAKLPKSDFGEPGKRAYPMPDKSHAVDAKARATQAVNAGRMSKGTEEKIDAKADRKLGKKGATDGMGRGKGGWAVHSTAAPTNMHSDDSMHKEKY